MLSLLYPAFDELQIADSSEEALRPDEIRLRVAACGICGSELEAFKNRSPRRPPPLVMGHEFCGTIDRVGPEVENWGRGMRVVCNALVPCGACIRCYRGDTHLCDQRQVFGMNRPGAFAEFVNVPARCLLPWPDGLSAEIAAMAEPLANGVHVARLSQHLRASTSLIIGAGPIGLFCQQAMQVMRGARVFVADLSPERLEVAMKLGAAGVVNPRTDDIVRFMASETSGEGADLVIDAAGSAGTKKTSLAAIRPGGAVVWIGLHENTATFDTYGITLPEKQILGTYAARMDDMRLAIEWMAEKRVDAHSWVTRFPLRHGVEAFQRMLAAQGSDIKAVLCP